MQYDSKNFLKKEDFEISKKSRKSDRVIVKPNAFPAVPLPKGGVSYNPDSVQHQDALAEQLAMEVSLEEKEQEDRRLPGGLTKEELHNKKMGTGFMFVGSDDAW